MAHVFIVDERTLPVHLKYKFAGTGAKDFKCDFLNKENKINPNIEKLLCGMLADISRVKIGDNILFYLQQTKNHEGMFFGSFRVVKKPFISNGNYLFEELQKNLTFRINIEPNEVYEKGITERECLDSLKGIKHPSELCWSLIYRKLKANRGCTMITNYEYENIMQKIKQKNNGKCLLSNNFDYDKKDNLIIATEQENLYAESGEKIDIKPRLLFKYKNKKAYETHLQAYILQNISNIEVLKVSNLKLNWLGNEVSCGVGMQSIDVCFTQEDNEKVNIVICELKDEQPVEAIEKQINKYIDWIMDYLVPTYRKKVNIFPTIIAPVPKQATFEMYNKICNQTIYSDVNVTVGKIRYIYFEINENEIEFKEIKPNDK